MRKFILKPFAAAALLTPTLFAAVTGNFVPDAVFKGSSLTGWRSIGSVKWSAQNGEIIAAPEARQSGWLMHERTLQDVALAASWRCAGDCKVAVLLRAETLPNGGMRGILASLTEPGTPSFRVTLDAAGNELSRERLRTGPGGVYRVAPDGPAPAGAAPATGPVRTPDGTLIPLPRPSADFRPSEWNTIEFALDANVLRTWRNNLSTGQTVAEEDFGRFGPFALWVGGTGDVRFRDVAWRDLQPKPNSPEKVSSRFRKQSLSPFYYGWGPTVADINRDGVADVVAGPFWYAGPSYTTAREIYMAKTINPSTDFYLGVQYAGDFNGDGWTDILNVEFTKPSLLFINPKGASHRWEQHTITGVLSSEMSLMRDVDGDGKPDLVYKDSQNQYVYVKPDPAKPTEMWQVHPISEKAPWPNHGLGLGDLNGDGRIDMLNPVGWWEQPKNGAGEGPWKYHPWAFSDWNRTSPGGAEMAVYDVNGDGLKDVVTSLHAHGFGLAWFEQKKAATGELSFVQHDIMGDFTSKNAGRVTFTEPHGATSADMDGDGIPDFITGKRNYSHHDSFIDPDPFGDPVLYVYRTVRNPKVPGGAEFVPELIHNNSGVGSSVTVADLNGDGAPEIITSTKTGSFIFWNRGKAKPAAK
ncbi:MAG: DUF1080 domain-containing protein [Acidobacteriia bacterium]|nr:DUF1080 domain-containing protein [Terriglobia bacterium]